MTSMTDIHSGSHTVVMQRKEGARGIQARTDQESPVKVVIVVPVETATSKDQEIEGGADQEVLNGNMKKRRKAANTQII